MAGTLPKKYFEFKKTHVQYMSTLKVQTQGKYECGSQFDFATQV